MRRRWPEVLVLAAGAAGLVLAAWSAPGVYQAIRAGQRAGCEVNAVEAAAYAAGMAGCDTDAECEAAERAAIAAFEMRCFAGEIPCIDRRPK